MSTTVSKVLVILAGFLVIGLLISGCDNLFGDDEDDGTLTVSVSGATGGDEFLCGTDEPLFIFFVFPGGSFTNIDQAKADGLEPLSANGDVINESGSASATAVLFGDSGPTDTVWKGKGGNRYDVVPTVFCVDNPDDPGTELSEGEPEYIHPTIGYKQDGNKSISTLASDFVEQTYP